MSEDPQVTVLDLTADGQASVDYDLGTGVFTFVTRYNYSAQLWYLDILDSQQNVLLAGRALVPNVDILHPFQEQKKLLGQLVVREFNPGDHHSPDLLGVNVLLLWSPP